MPHNTHQNLTDHDLLIRIHERSERWEEVTDRLLGDGTPGKGTLPALEVRLQVLETDRENRIANQKLVAKVAKFASLAPVSAVLLWIWNLVHKSALPSR